MSGSWFRTGDLGRIDPERYVYYTGRLDDVINTGGFKVSPSEVEEALGTLLAGWPYCIVGAPGSVCGAVPVLCIEGEANGPDSWAFAFQLDGLPPDQLIPKVVRHRPAPPGTTSGKIIRRIVQQWVA
jgi:acyl-CoA synthetase (AMP-forming)/AMP-acid ligase II